MVGGNGIGASTKIHTVKNSLFTNNWQCFHQHTVFFINFLKQNAGDIRDNRFGNDPFFNLDCFLNHRQEMPTKVTNFNRHFHFDIMETGLDILDDELNWTITRAEIFDWTKPKGVERTQKITGQVSSHFLKNTTSRREQTEVLKAQNRLVPRSQSLGCFSIIGVQV